MYIDILNPVCIILPITILYCLILSFIYIIYKGHFLILSCNKNLYLDFKYNRQMNSRLIFLLSMALYLLLKIIIQFQTL